MRGLLLALALAGCAVRPPPGPAPAPRYVIGAGYQVNGAWFYPAEDFGYVATGLAERLPDRTGLTANGETFEASAMAGAHQTLQLPAIVRVTNLETGLQALVRINERGPAAPGRLLGLTRRAADVLGVPASGAAQVRVQVESGASQALRDRLQGAPLGMSAAPVAGVAAESLAPPPGVGQSARGRVASRTALAGEPVPAEAAWPARLPDVAEHVPARPGQLWIDAGQFGQASYANQVRARLYALPAAVERVSEARSPRFRVRVGPLAGVGAADAALDRARAAGVTDARIVVE
ncbi:MAG: septal ring lytic transglycosylase RlpA family protein [Acetobacteraceae bacterium]